MIAEDLLVSVVLASGRVDETTSEDIENTGLKEDQFLLVGLADRAVQLSVSWQQVFVVGLSRKQEILRIAIEIDPSRLVDELITQQIGLIGQVGGHYLPSLAQVVQKPSLIAEEILLQFHHIVSEVILGEGNLQAILNKRKPLLIISNLDLQRCRKALSLCGPSGQSFSAKLLHKQILMRIKQHIDPKLVALPHDFPYGLDVCVVVLPLLRFDALPRAVQADDVHAPMLEVVEVVIGEAVVGVEVLEVGVEGEDLVDCVDSVVNGVAVVLVHEHRVVGVDSDAGKDEEQREQQKRP